jgi:catechol 2,3-dioxygenase-like lactoylglutathione lyase family enzyme
MSARELRVCVTAPDYDEALRFYRDVLGRRVASHIRLAFEVGWTARRASS